MSYINYEDPVLNAIIKVLDEHGPAILKGRYGIGDPVVVNKSQLAKPMAFVYYAESATTEPTNSHLGITRNVVVNLVHDMTKDFGQGLKARSHNTLVGLMEGMTINEAGIYRLDPNSVLGALRGHQDVDGQLRLGLGSSDQIEYDAMPRNKGIMTAEAVLNITATVQVLNPRFAPKP